MVVITRNVNVRSYAPSVEVIVAVMYRLEVVVKVSRAPIGTEHLFCFISSVFVYCSVMKFMLDGWILSYWCLSFKTLTCAVMIITLDNDLNAAGLVRSSTDPSIVGVIDYVLVCQWKMGLEARLFAVSPICGLSCVVYGEWEMKGVAKKVLWIDCLMERILDWTCWNETLSVVLPCVTSYDGVLRTPDMTRCGNLALYVPSGGSWCIRTLVWPLEGAREGILFWSYHTSR